MNPVDCGTVTTSPTVPTTFRSTTKSVVSAEITSNLSAGLDVTVSGRWLVSSLLIPPWATSIAALMLHSCHLCCEKMFWVASNLAHTLLPQPTNTGTTAKTTPGRLTVALMATGGCANGPQLPPAYRFDALCYIKLLLLYINPGEFGNKVQRMSTSRHVSIV